MTATCKTPGCDRDPLSPKIVEVLGDRTDGLCAYCAAAKQREAEDAVPSTSARTSEQEEFSAVELEAHRREVEMFNTGRATDEEILAGNLAQPQATDEQLSLLRQLYQLHERISGQATLLEDRDRQIVEEALRIGRVKQSDIADSIGVHRTTVGRRVKKLLEQAPALHRFATTLVGEAKPQPGSHIATMFKAYAWYRKSRDSEPPEGVPSFQDYLKLNRMYQGGWRATRILHPPIGPRIDCRGEKIVITGSGDLHPMWHEAIRAGDAIRIYDPPRCHYCGKLLAKASTGRPRKFCDERCRSRYRRK